MIPAGYEIDWNSWIAGFAVLTSLFAAAVSYYASTKAKEAADNANEIANLNLSLTAELEIVRFREKWLADVRDQMSVAINILTTNPKHLSNSTQANADLKNSITRLFLLLPHDDSKTGEFMDELHVLQKNFNDRFDGKEAVSPAETIMLGKEILKREWKRIKMDLEQINAKNK